MLNNEYKEEVFTSVHKELEEESLLNGDNFTSRRRKAAGGRIDISLFPGR